MTFARLVVLCLLALVADPVRAQLAPAAAPPDPCSGVLLPCAQINDLTLTTRLAGSATWPGAAGAWSSTGVLGVTASVLKTVELGLALPVTYDRGESFGTWTAGPPAVQLRWRMGPRMGWPPFGGAYPPDEPFYKERPAAYDLAPARWTLTLGLSFQPRWPHLAGPGETALTVAGDLHLWRFLWTTQLGAHVLPDGGSAWSAGGRLAIDVAGVASLFGEALGRQDLQHLTGRQGLALVGAQLLPFRGARLTGYYGRGVGGAHVAGALIDLPLGVHGYSLADLARLVAYVDPVVGGTGWLYDDECNPLYRLGSVQGDQVYDEWRKAWIPVGTHLWRRGAELYFDREGKVPYGPVRRSEGRPPPVTGVAEIPWPAVRDLQRSTPEGRAWLARWARSPLPERQRQCATLMDATQKELEAGARAATLGDACAAARESQQIAEQVTRPVQRRDIAGGVALAGMVGELVFCGGADTSKVRVATQAAALIAATVVLRTPPPHPAAAPPRALPPGPAPLPPARQLAGRQQQLALPPAAAAAPGPRAAPAPAAQAVPASWLPAATPAASTASHAPPVAYHRPPNATTPRQRRSVQGKPCADCGKTAPVMVADHKTPLVVEHYTTGQIDRAKMHAVDAVQPQCPTCSAKQGAALRQYSAAKKKGQTP